MKQTFSGEMSEQANSFHCSKRASGGYHEANTRYLVTAGTV